MYRSILVPLDGSTFSEHALPTAARIARLAGAHLQLVRVIPDDPLEDIFYSAGPRYPWDEGRTYLRRTADQVEARTGLRPSLRLLGGPVADTLCEYATGCGADLVVMTTHARGRRVPRPLL